MKHLMVDLLELSIDRLLEGGIGIFQLRGFCGGYTGACAIAWVGGDGRID